MFADGVRREPLRVVELEAGAEELERPGELAREDEGQGEAAFAPPHARRCAGGTEAPARDASRSAAGTREPSSSAASAGDGRDDGPRDERVAVEHPDDGDVGGGRDGRGLRDRLERLRQRRLGRERPGELRERAERLAARAEPHGVHRRAEMA